MDDARVALLLASVETLRSTLKMGGVLAAGSIVGTVLLACMLYWTGQQLEKVGGLFRRATRGYRNARRASRVQRRRGERLTEALATARAQISELQRENRRLAGIRAKAERGVRAKHEELEQARDEARLFRNVPTLTVEVDAGPPTAPGDVDVEV